MGLAGGSRGRLTLTVCVSEVDEVFVQFELEFFYYTGIDGDSYFIVTAHDSGAGMTAVSANPTFVAFAPVPSLIEITGYAETFVVACDSIARIIGGCLGLCGSENCQRQNEISARSIQYHSWRFQDLRFLRSYRSSS